MYIRRSKGGQAPPFEEFLRLRSFDALISFVARGSEEVLKWFGILSFPCQVVGPALVTFASFILRHELASTLSQFLLRVDMPSFSFC